MNLYRQTIILFGIVVPVLISAAVIGVGFMVKSKMTASFENKEKNYKLYQQSNMAVRQIEAQVTREREHLNRWNEQLSQETASAISTNLRAIMEKLPTKEIQLTASERSSSAGGFGSASAQNSSQIRIALRGTYRTLQRAFLELETRMPQLQLQELKMDPSSNQSTLMNLQVTYTAWEN